MKHDANSRFWRLYKRLPKDIRALADRNFALLKTDSAHPSLHFKKVGALGLEGQSRNVWAQAVLQPK